MRTGRSLTVCWCLLPGGRSLVPRGSAWSGGVSGPRGCLWSGGCLWSRGVCLVWGGGLASQHALRQTPGLWTESQTPVKTLPWPNFVAAGKNIISEKQRSWLGWRNEGGGFIRINHRWTVRRIQKLPSRAYRACLPQYIPLHHLNPAVHRVVYHWFFILTESRAQNQRNVIDESLENLANDSRVVASLVTPIWWYPLMVVL